MNWQQEQGVNSLIQQKLKMRRNIENDWLDMFLSSSHDALTNN